MWTRIVRLKIHAIVSVGCVRSYCLTSTTPYTLRCNNSASLNVWGLLNIYSASRLDQRTKPASTRPKKITSVLFSPFFASYSFILFSSLLRCRRCHRRNSRMDKFIFSRKKIYLYEMEQATWSRAWLASQCSNNNSHRRLLQPGQMQWREHARKYRHQQQQQFAMSRGGPKSRHNGSCVVSRPTNRRKKFTVLLSELFLVCTAIILCSFSFQLSLSLWPFFFHTKPLFPSQFTSIFFFHRQMHFISLWAPIYPHIWKIICWRKK